MAQVQMYLPDTRLTYIHAACDVGSHPEGIYFQKRWLKWFNLLLLDGTMAQYIFDKTS